MQGKVLEYMGQHIKILPLVDGWAYILHNEAGVQYKTEQAAIHAAKAKVRQECLKAKKEEINYGS